MPCSFHRVCRNSRYSNGSTHCCLRELFLVWSDYLSVLQLDFTIGEIWTKDFHTNKTILVFHNKWFGKICQIWWIQIWVLTLCFCGYLVSHKICIFWQKLSLHMSLSLCFIFANFHKNTIYIRYKRLNIVKSRLQVGHG